MRTINLIVAACVLGFASVTSQATPVRWDFDLDLLNFSPPGPAGKAIGSFLYDADSNTYSNVSFVTTPGAGFPGASYGFVFGGIAPTDKLVSFVTATGDLTGAFRFTFNFLASLTNAGGTVGILESDAGEIQCNDAICSGLNPELGLRFPPTGSFVTGTPVPEPSVIAMFGLALIGLGFLRGMLRV